MMAANVNKVGRVVDVMCFLRVVGEMERVGSVGMFMKGVVVVSDKGLHGPIKA